MKIAIITDTYWPRVNGVAVSIDILKKELIERGHNVFILAPEYPGLCKEEKGVFRFKSLSVIISKEDRLVCFTERRKIFKLFSRLEPNVIHIHTEFLMGIFALSFAKKNSVPVVITGHTCFALYNEFYLNFIPAFIRRRLFKLYEKKIFNSADVIIAPSEDMKNMLESFGIKKEINIIPTSLDDKFSPENVLEIKKNSNTIRKQFPIVKGKRVLLFVGRIAKGKNIIFLLDVFELLLKKYNNIVLIIAGDGPYRRKLESIAENRDLNNHILFTGYMDYLRVGEIYSIADLFLFPSKTESQGLVIMEAMAFGLPIVAINAMGTRSLVCNNKGGFTTGDDVKEFYSKVDLLLQDRKLYNLKSNEAIEISNKRFGKLMIDEVLKCYSTAIKINRC